MLNKKEGEKMKYVFFAAVFLFIGGFTEQKDKGIILVKIENVRNTAGQIRASLYNTGDGFPGSHEKAYKVTTQPINDKDSVVIEFQGVEYGEYAVAIFHDEDNDGKMKTGMYGIPEEGYAFSNDAEATYGPPTFDDAKIVLHSDTLAIKVKMRY